MKQNISIIDVHFMIYSQIRDLKFLINSRYIIYESVSNVCSSFTVSKGRIRKPMRLSYVANLNLNCRNIKGISLRVRLQQHDNQLKKIAGEIAKLQVAGNCDIRNGLLL